MVPQIVTSVHWFSFYWGIALRNGSTLKALQVDICLNQGFKCCYSLFSGVFKSADPSLVLWSVYRFVEVLKDIHKSQGNMCSGQENTKTKDKPCSHSEAGKHILLGFLGVLSNAPPPKKSEFFMKTILG